MLKGKDEVRSRYEVYGVEVKSNVILDEVSKDSLAEKVILQ
jgi:hypothetical protein